MTLTLHRSAQRPYPDALYLEYAIALPDGTLAQFTCSPLTPDRPTEHLAELNAGNCLCNGRGEYRDRNGYHQCYCEVGKAMVDE